MPKVAQETLTEFGQAVKRARGLKGWTLDALGREMEGSSGKSFLSNIEKGQRDFSVQTVGRLIQTLGLDESWMDRFMGTEAEDEITEQDQRAEKLLVAAEKEGASGVAEGLLIALAYEHAEGETTDLDSAYRGLKVALETAREMAERAALPDNTDAGLSAVRAEVQRLNEAEDIEGAGAAIDDAIQRQAAGMSALLDLGVQQDRLRNDPEAAAKKLVQQVDMEGAVDRFEALRAVFFEWYERGRDKGVAFDLLVSIALTRETRQRAASAGQHGNGLNDLGTALSILGERESGTDRLQEAVTAFRNALEEWNRDRVPLDWAMTQMNLGNALLTLGERESGTDRLQEAVTAYRNALQERTRDRLPLDWAMTQVNLGNALQTLGERESGTDRLQEAVTAYRNALQEWTRDRVPLYWAGTQNNLGTALKTLGEREVGTAQLEEAVTVYRDALKERTRDRLPVDWAKTHFNIAELELAFFDKTSDPGHLDAAEGYVREALAVFEEAGANYYVMMAEEVLAKIAEKRVG